MGKTLKFKPKKQPESDWIDILECECGCDDYKIVVDKEGYDWQEITTIICSGCGGRTDMERIIWKFEPE